MKGATSNRWLVAVAIAVGGCNDDKASLCTSEETAPPPEALLRTGDAMEGSGVVLPNGRELFTGASVPDIHVGHPVDMVSNPTLPVVYVADARYGGGGNDVRCSRDPSVRHRGIHVVQVDPMMVLQAPEAVLYSTPLEGDEGNPFVCPDRSIPADGAFGLAINQQGTKLYASSGISGYVLPFDIDNSNSPTGHGRLIPRAPISIGGFTAGIAFSPDESSLFVVRFLGANADAASSIAEIALGDPKDPGPSRPPRVLDTEVSLIGFGAYGIAVTSEGPTGIRLWVSGFRAGPVETTARSSPTSNFGKLGQITLAKNPEGIVPYRGGVVVALSDTDQLAFLRPPPASSGDANPVVWKAPISVGRYLSSGTELLGASPSQFVIDGDRAYVTLATDDVMSIVDLLGSDPEQVVNVGQSPSAVAFVNPPLPAGRAIVVANGKSLYGPQCPAGGCAPLTTPMAVDAGIVGADSGKVADAGTGRVDAGKGMTVVTDAGTPAARAPIPSNNDHDSTCRTPPANVHGDGINVCTAVSSTVQERVEIAKQIYFDPTKEEGTLSVIGLETLASPAQETARARRRLEHPVGAYANGCNGDRFPIPSSSNASDQIKHVVLIVRENKTYDFLLGALEPDRDGKIRNGSAAFEADNIRAAYGWPAITPNLHQLARQYTSLDNFYADSEVSTQGHSWLTNSFVNDYLERIHLEEDSHDTFGFDFSLEVGLPGAEPGSGSFFEHLMRHAVPFTIFGEADGILGSVGDSFVINHVDLGVPPNDKEHSDIPKAIHIASVLTGSKNPPSFSYVLLPRDHTEVISAGKTSPVSLIAENDQATGMLVQSLSSDPDLWKSTVVFLVEDDAQQGYDHVDYHRSICLVIGPWARAGHNSSVHASFPALFHTIEKILGLPPMNRFDASAPILWDAFTGSPAPEAFSPFQSECARVPLDATNPSICETPDQEEVVEIDEHPDREQLVWRAVTGSLSGTALGPP